MSYNIYLNLRTPFGQYLEEDIAFGMYTADNFFDRHGIWPPS